MFKRILACLLVLVTLVSYLPPKASAAETQPQIKNDVTMEGTNSFGTLLANTVQNDPQSQSEGEDSRICDLQIEGTLATVEYTTDRAAKVVVAIYTEDGATMLGSGVTEVVPEDTQTVVEIQIASMPRYYSAAAYLLDAETNDPLSQVFRTQLYTKVVQDLKNSTVEDYDPERVLNLDNSNTTNFAVFGENTILMQEGSPCQISGGNGVYTVTNADERFLSMKAGDSFAAPQSDGSTLIVKAAKVSVQGDTVTIYEDADADLTDVFDFVKIEGGSTTDNVTYDDSGLDPELSIISEEEFLSQTNDDDEYAIDTYAVDVDEHRTYKKDFKTKGSYFTGSFEFGLSASVKAYITPRYQYVSLGVKLSLTGKITVKAKFSKDFEIGIYGVELCAGCYLQITPKVYFNVSCALTYKINWEASIGEEFDSDIGEWKDTSNPSKVKSSADFSGSVYIGVGTETVLAFVSKHLFSATVEAQAGVTISGKQEIPTLSSSSDSVLHRCMICIDGEIKGSLKISLSYKIFGEEKSIGDFGKSWKLSDFFYCVDENEFGFTKCPHKVFRIKLTVRDSGGAPLEGASVWLYDREGNPAQVTLVDNDGTYIADDIPNTDEKGQTVFYLPNGEYQLEAVKDDQRRAMDITVHEGAKEPSIGLTVQSGETAIRMVPEQLTLDVNAQEQLKVLFGNYRQALDVTNACVWSCGNPKVATVEKGKVTAVGPGTAAVVASYTKDGERYFVRCNVTVKGTDATSGKCGDNLYWKITEDNTLEIYGKGEMWDYWDSPAAPWRSYEPQRLVLRNGITKIGRTAFEGCTSLTGSLIIPDSVIDIGSWAFRDCSGFTGDLMIPDRVTSIGTGAFSGCSGFSGDLIIPEGVKSIESHTFSYCSGFTGVLEIPSTVTGIGSGAFYDCNFTGCLNIPDNVTTIGANAFWRCDKFVGTLTIPNSVTSIGESAFSYCMFSGDLIIPGSVKTIEKDTFKYCRNFNGDLIISAGVKEIEEGAFYGCEGFTGNLEIGEGVVTIGTRAFNDCGRLTGDLIIPNSVTSIGKDAFFGCESLDGRLILSDKLTAISEGAFGCCGKLSGELVIPDGVTIIGASAFACTFNMTTVRFPASVKEVGEEAFGSNTEDKDIWYAGTVKQWNQIKGLSASDITGTIHCSDGTIEQGVRTFAEQPDETTETVPTEETVPETTAETTPETTGPSTESTQPQETAQPLSTITWFRVPKGAKMEDGAAVRLSAHTGKETVRNGVRSVAFVGLEPGEEYVLIVSLKPGSVQPEDLQYIEQSAADGNGSVSFTYIPRTEVSAITQLYGISAQRKITLDREYLTIPMGSLSEPIQATVDPEEWTDDLVWFSENEDVVTVDENGCVTPVSVGTGYVVAEVTHGKYTITARCRVDVTEKVANEEVLGVDLGTKKVTTELYSTDYAKIDILPRLKQNEIALFSFFSAVPKDNGVAITSAYLEDENARQFFELRVKDDRQLLLVPTQEALDNAKDVKSSYSSKIVVLVNGVEYHTDDAVTISVKKTMPKLKAANLTFNPFYTEQSQALTITGGTVTKVEGTTPDWLTMDGTKLTLSNAPKSGSASLNLLVYTTEWAIPVNVKASVKLSYKAPRLKLSASSVTLSETDSLGVTLKLTAGKQSLEELNVKSVTLPAGFEDTELNLYTGEIALVPIGEIPTGKQAVRVSFYGTDSVLDLPLRVNKRTPTLRLSKTSVSLNAELGDSMTLKVTATPADLDLAKVTVTNPSEALEVSPVNEDGEFTVTVKQGSASKASYALMVQAPTGRAVKLTVRTLAAGQKVTMSLKAAGSIDLTFPEKGVALQPKYRNYAGELENVVYTLALKQGKATLDAAFDDYLTVGEDGLIRWNGTGSLESGNVCLITMMGELPNGTMLFATAQVRVTQTPVILRLSKARLSLNKRLEEKTQVMVTTSTRGYTLGDVELLVTDNKNVPSDGLTAAYENGLLTLSVNEKTVYGGSYKVQLWVTPKRVTTLMVRIPAEKKSAVTMTARARGGIDVIRDASEVVVTPIYRNCLDGASLKKQVKVTWAQDGRNYSQDVTEDFILTWAQDGTLHVSKVPGKELALTGKYRLEILCEGMEKEAYTALSVKCGTARFTVASVSLYAKDANDMARLTITTTDKTVNTLERVELKDARLKGTYEVLDLGGGQFALCLIPGAKAKTGTVTLNLFCEGNTTAKPSGTVSVKVEIR